MRVRCEETNHRASSAWLTQGSQPHMLSHFDSLYSRPLSTRNELLSAIGINGLRILARPLG